MKFIIRFYRRRVRRPATKKSQTDYLQHKETARALMHERVAYFCPKLGVTCGRIAIKNLRTRWGSCSKKGNLNFNYRVVRLPPELVDYLVVHELCHLIEFNHSRRFWDLVAQLIPEHKACRQRLRNLV